MSANAPLPPEASSGGNAGVGWPVKSLAGCWRCGGGGEISGVLTIDGSVSGDIDVAVLSGTLRIGSDLSGDIGFSALGWIKRRSR